MADTTTRGEQVESRGKEARVPQARSGTGTDVPAAERGRTSIADSVVEKIVGVAAREVPGIHNLGGGAGRALGAVRERVPGGQRGVTRGVKVEVGERQAAVDLNVVVEYGIPIMDVAREVRSSVISAVEHMAGLDVVEVNVAVDDVHLPEDEEEEPEGRVE